MKKQNSKKTFAAGEIIMEQGTPGDCAYIIEDGLVEIIVEREGGNIQHVGTRSAGTIIGEMAIVDEAPRTATVKALENCEMLEISRQEFSQRLEETDPVIQLVSRVILTRYRDLLTRAHIQKDSLTWPPPETVEKSHTRRTEAVETVKMGNRFKTALENGDLSLHYQPIVDMAEGHVRGFEALMRWIHPKDGFISPGEFIPVAEKSGLIVEASKWALRTACEALKRIEDTVQPDEPFYMSVNFSSHDFASFGFVDNVLETAQETGIDPKQIKLEITERLLIQQPDMARDTLQACREAGMGIAIDDFGTGYSSLSYLYYFPIDILKIDQSFIRAMFKEERSLELVRSIVGLGQNMGMKIIAEGVEEEEDARLLRQMGCEAAQGYYFARPAPEEELIPLLKSWKTG